ncbi:MAG: Hemolysin-type calcium-binding region [Acidobacteria bacterium]|nr:Hemolysin-type calcium-binding region [Acidobacteriota bacterium]
MTTRTLVLISLLAVSSAAIAQDYRIDVDRAHFDAATGALPAHITVTNDSDAPISGVELFFAGQLVHAASGSGWTCTESRNQPTKCDFAGTFAAGEIATVDAIVVFAQQPSRISVDGNLFWTNAAGQRTFISRRLPLAVYKAFVVTRTADSGSGSLRDAIVALNADAVCASLPCGIAFNFAPSADEKWQTIHVRSELPALTAADVTIDGDSQSIFAGDTNADGPEVELRGEGVAGDGFDFRSAVSEVRGMAIGGFGRNGIALTVRLREHGVFRFLHNYLGTDATGSNAAPNGLRGISITGGYVEGEIRDNVLSGNGRSGLWVWTEQSPGFRLAESMNVAGNRAGLQAHSDAPLPNGASGMFFGPAVDGAAVEGNTIAYNRDFGVAVGRGARLMRVRGNSIAHNGVGGIDVGLDGPTPAGVDAEFSDVPAPLLQSATYDAATNTTTIAATVPPSFYFVMNQVDFYVSETREHGDYAEGERYLGTSKTQPGTNVRTLTVPGDLRGRFVSGVTFRTRDAEGSLLYDTGEPSNAIEVK